MLKVHCKVRENSRNNYGTKYQIIKFKTLIVHLLKVIYFEYSRFMEQKRFVDRQANVNGSMKSPGKPQIGGESGLYISFSKLAFLSSLAQMI